MDRRSQVIHAYLLLSTALLAQMLLCQIEGFNSAILDYQVWAGLQGPGVEQELNTVEPLLTDPPRSGLPLNNGHISRNGMTSHRASVF